MKYVNFLCLGFVLSLSSPLASAGIYGFLPCAEAHYRDSFSAGIEQGLTGACSALSKLDQTCFNRGVERGLAVLAEHSGLDHRIHRECLENFYDGKSNGTNLSQNNTRGADACYSEGFDAGRAVAENPTR